MPTSATQHRLELVDVVDVSFDAIGMSLVPHPLNPYVLTVHMNVCMVGAAGVSWFGGGVDLTLYYGFEDDCVRFHRACCDALALFGADKYLRFEQWCDAYFYNCHRQEPHGIGGIFFDDFTGLGPTIYLARIQSVGEAFSPTYLPIMARRNSMIWDERERQHQLWRRGCYVEFWCGIVARTSACTLAVTRSRF